MSMVCSSSGVRLYAATPRSGPGLCAAARFVSVKQQGSDGCSGWQDYFFHFFRMPRYEQFFFGDAELFSPPLIGQFLKDSFSGETIFQEHETFFWAFFTSKMISVTPLTVYVRVCCH